MAPHFHVTSVVNRDSITRHGLDSSRMGAAPGIAGSRTPEQHGCFLAPDEELAQWFVRMNNTGGPVDVWEVTGVNDDDLVLSGEGFHYLPGAIAHPPATGAHRPAPVMRRDNTTRCHRHRHRHRHRRRRRHRHRDHRRDHPRLAGTGVPPQG